MRRSRVLAVLVALGVPAAACTLAVDTKGLAGAPEPNEGGSLDGPNTGPGAEGGNPSPGADADVDAEAGAEIGPQTPCPDTVGAMINVGSYCIDAIEVTFARYDAFLATFPDAGAVDAGDQPPYCRWNTDLRHGSFNTFPDNPVTQLDWCDAYAYCKWAGKRLCGDRHGGSTPFAKANDPAESQWYNACSSGGKNAWVYGNTYQPTTCRGVDYGDGYDYAASGRTAAGCRAPDAPFTGVYDLCGNAEEFEDSCDSYTDDLDRCHTRGGDRQGTSVETRCDADLTRTRNEQGTNLGFRCCWP
jgi:formylglycine-generating enzyme required for sulfatase activity